MKTHRPAFLLIIAILFAASIQAYSCTTFCLKSARHLVFGKNFDFYTGVGQVVINKRNIRKRSFILPPERPLEWTSRYGSITFNQMGREFPYGGMNEKGLVIEQMWLADSRYPEMDERYGLFELQWLQYQLDNAASVEEVLASNATVRISKLSAPLHFLILDAGGNMATVEYVNGKMVFHTQSNLPVGVLSNDTYESSQKHLNTLPDLKEYCKNASTSSFSRFAKATAMVRDFSDQNPVDYGFDILKTVSQGDFTRWSIVYDVRNMTIHYTTQHNKARRTIQLQNFDFSCHSPSLYVGIDENLPQHEKSFLPYSFKENRRTIVEAFDAISDKPEFIQTTPSAEEKEFIARYPDTTACGDKLDQH